MKEEIIQRLELIDKRTVKILKILEKQNKEKEQTTKKAKPNKPGTIKIIPEKEYEIDNE